MHYLNESEKTQQRVKGENPWIKHWTAGKDTDFKATNIGQFWYNYLPGECR
jgi:hypothetical protein